MAVHFSTNFPKIPADKKNCLLIFDRKLSRTCQKFIAAYPCRYSVRAGESLKDLSTFPGHFGKLEKLASGIATGQLKVIALGGGSVGDFAGFFASVYRRGVGLIHIPSTWLAAIDSAHGGKTALNHLGKNQLGTFYPAEQIFISRRILQLQPKQRVQDAFGEVFKIALLSGGGIWDRLSRRTDIDQAYLWKELPALIEAKMKIVSRDPKEKKGYRALLNLGHTVGHLIETQLGYSHGRSVLLGTLFALRFSEQLGSQFYGKLQGLPMAALLPSKEETAEVLCKIKKPEILLLKDKKLASAQKLRFVFLYKPGEPQIRELPIGLIVSEIQRQGRLI